MKNIIGITPEIRTILEQRITRNSMQRNGKTAKPAAAKKKVKKLQYNYKQMSARIMRAKTSGNARSAVISAKQQVASLRRHLQTGQYNDRELLAAIRHAEAIARVAKKHQKHLEEEENAKQGGICFGSLDEKEELEQENTDGILEGQQAEELSQDMMSEAMQEMLQNMSKEQLEEMLEDYEEMLQETLDSLEDMTDLEELSEELMQAATKDMDPEDLELLKKKHRSDELRDIMLADMEYLKTLFKMLEKEKESAGQLACASNDVDVGVSLELGGAFVPVTFESPPVVTEGAHVDAVV